MEKKGKEKPSLLKTSVNLQFGKSKKLQTQNCKIVIKQPSSTYSTFTTNNFDGFTHKWNDD
jgi:hypothetical protein